VVFALVVSSLALTVGALALMRGHDRQHDGVAGHVSGDLRPEPPTIPDPEGWWGTALSDPIEAQPFTLIDQHGQAFSFPPEGRVSLLYFGYTHCPDICPGTMATIAEAERRLDPATAAAIEVVFVTTDPGRDTVARLAEWLTLFDGSFVGLTGSIDDVTAVQRRYDVPIAERQDLGDDAYASVHLDQVLAFGRDGVARRAYAPDTDPDALAADLARMVAEGP
jgi:protein SCO1/2